MIWIRLGWLLHLVPHLNKLILTPCFYIWLTNNENKLVICFLSKVWTLISIVLIFLTVCSVLCLSVLSCLWLFGNPVGNSVHEFSVKNTVVGRDCLLHCLSWSGFYLLFSGSLFSVWLWQTQISVCKHRNVLPFIYNLFYWMLCKLFLAVQQISQNPMRFQLSCQLDLRSLRLDQHGKIHF